MVLGRHIFKLCTDQLGVNIKAYHTNNGLFASNRFKENLVPNKNLDFRGIGDQHQKWGCKNEIENTTWSAIEIIIHVDIHWTNQ